MWRHNFTPIVASLDLRTLFAVVCVCITITAVHGGDDDDCMPLRMAMMSVRPMSTVCRDLSDDKCTANCAKAFVPYITRCDPILRPEMDASQIASMESQTKVCKAATKAGAWDPNHSFKPPGIAVDTNGCMPPPAAMQSACAAPIGSPPIGSDGASCPPACAAEFLPWLTRCADVVRHESGFDFASTMADQVRACQSTADGDCTRPTDEIQAACASWSTQGTCTLECAKLFNSWMVRCAPALRQRLTAAEMVPMKSQNKICTATLRAEQQRGSELGTDSVDTSATAYGDCLPPAAIEAACGSINEGEQGPDQTALEGRWCCHNRSSGVRIAGTDESSAPQVAMRCYAASRTASALEYGAAPKIPSCSK